MKTGRIFWGVGFILLALIFILDAVGIMTPLVSAIGEVSLPLALAGLLFVSYAVSRLIAGKVSEIFIPLAVVFIIFEKNIAFLCGREDPDLINNWLILGCAVLLSIGFGILFPNTGDHRIFNAKVNVNRSSGSHLTSNLSSKAVYIDASDFQWEMAKNELGALTVNFSNADLYQGGGELCVRNDLGFVQINVPSSWQFTYNIENNLGSITAAKQSSSSTGPLLIIKGENNMGKISINLI